ncbi:MAG TPA: DinB family protein, partial [Anaerolineales bacterium]|nr:DinB family protein [Anaerolineales bacterium]
WYIAYHTLFWLDLYLTGSVENFSPPQPFTLDELDPRGILPERVYTLDELSVYLAHCRQKCQATIDQMTDEGAQRLCYFLWVKDGIKFIELLLDNMRHVQEHAAQLNMFLGQQAGIDARWIARTNAG